MNYVEILLGLITISILAMAAYSLLRDHLNNNPARSFLKDQSFHKTPVLPYLSPGIVETIPVSVSKGKAFEYFVAAKFDRKYFKYLEWRNDKFHKGMYPLSNKHPDLEYEFRHKHHHVRFAVECKWLLEFQDDAIKWTDTKQMDQYFTYGLQEKVLVFVAIGVGGTPDQPDKLYVVPLLKMHKNQLYLTSRFLQPYLRSTNSAFFFDTNLMLLS